MYLTLIFYIHTINLLYAIAGLAILVVSLGLVWDLVYNQQRLYTRFVERYVWVVITATTLGGVATTLLYSEVFEFVPCSLCWLQRVALYPQALMSIAAWRVKDQVLFPLYGMVLSGFGFLVAVYHYIYQNIPDEVREGVAPCLADGSADCADKIMNVFGFVTFPFLSATIFIFLFVIYWHMRRRNQ